MTAKVTNKRLRQLLIDLGFAKGESVKNHRRLYRHPQSHCVIVLPDNRDEDVARPADIASVRDHLDQVGHLSETIFDRFLVEGKLPAA